MLIVKTIILVLCIKIRLGVFAELTPEDTIQSQVHNATRLVDYLIENHIRGRAISAYEGSVARLPCGGATESGQKLTWTYAESMYNLTFRPMEEKEMAVDNGNLTVFYVRRPDSGLYQCHVESNASSLVVLRVLDDDDRYDVVKPPTSRGPYPSPATRVTSQLVSFSLWSAWSRCSRCGRVGRQRRYGMCHVRYAEDSMSNITDDSPFNSNNDVLLNDMDIKLFQAFPGGIPCRANLLPKYIIDLPSVGLRRNEIMIGLCKVPCKSQIFEVRSPAGEVAERANNSAGAYSLRQGEPPRPPPAPRDIIFATKGAAVLVKCPGTTLQDIPVIWRVGNEEIVPRELDQRTAGRVHVNARDHVVIVAAEYTDSNVYSCWQDRKLAGVIKLKLFEDTRAQCGRQLASLGLFCLLWLVRGALAACRRQRRGAI